MNIIFDYNNLSFILLIVFGVCLVIQLLFHWAQFSKVAFYKRNARPKLDEELEPASIVLCARDAYEYLTELIPVLLNQDYPDFEIVVVNDCSDDETEEYLKDLERREPRVKPVQLKQHLNFFNGKKFPLSMGIKSAQNDLIVLTDFNCMPVNDQWLRSVVNRYNHQTEIVIGYSPYVQKKGSLNHLMRFDALQNGLLYLSAALNHHAYMGIGKNLSYRKELFFRNKGFISHYTTAVGEDDLFINKVSTKKNTEVLIDAENAILTTPTSSFKLWMRQKSSRYSTVSKYDGRSRLMLSLFYGSQLLFYVSFITLIALCAKPAFVITGGAAFYIPILVFFFLLRFGSQMIIYHKASKRLGEKGLLPGLIVYDFLFAFLSPWLRLMGRMNVGRE
ncbi:MAG: glycosyltransferase [Bacteroidales bacterium]|nr:glycosyltransferase [Bacteroidales bacterium]MBR6930191.1 glycosyltransferase [Bacteroidales bacterium]